VEYRWSEETKTWHWHENCPEWPINSFNIVRLEKMPADFALCAKCTAPVEDKSRTVAQLSHSAVFRLLLR